MPAYPSPMTAEIQEIVSKIDPVLVDQSAQKNIQRAKARLRESQAISLRKAGATFVQIGEALHTSAQHAHAIVSRALARVVSNYKGKADEIRALELERLDAMWLKAWALMSPKGKEQDPLMLIKAIDTLLRIQERRSKYMGLDKETPLVQINNNTQNNTVNAAISPPAEADHKEMLKNATTEELLRLRELMTTIKSRMITPVTVIEKTKEPQPPLEGATNAAPLDPAVP